MGSDFGALLGLAIDTVSCLAFLKFYQWCKSNAERIKGTKDVEIGPELLARLQSTENGCIPYACVQGIVRPVNKALKSEFNPWQEGVIRRSMITEHKSKKTQGLWSDVKKVIRDSTQDVPFCLQKLFWRDEDGDSHLIVCEPREADYLMDSLTSTYDKFEPNKSSFMQRMTDRIFGDVSEGTQVSEEMLLCDTLLLGFGKVSLGRNGRMELGKPDSGETGGYILTQMTKSEIIRRLENKVTVFKVLFYISGFIGIGIVVYLIRKHYKDWKLRRENERFLDEMRNARVERTANRNQNVGATEEDNTCVICLTNAREVILLNCGHICVCAECVLNLPRPITCPVCRQAVERYLPVYNP